MIFSCRAILFDLDGVLVNSTTAVARVWEKWARAHALPPEKVIVQAHGRRSVETIRAVAPHINAEQENLRVEQMEIDDREGVTALPGAARLLSSLPQNRFAIVTSATVALARARMQHSGLQFPIHRVCAEDVTQGKPSPEPYLKGAELLGFAPQDCLVFEDAPAGIVSARAAGMRVIALPTTYPEKELSGAAAIVKSLSALQVECSDGQLRIETT